MQESMAMLKHVLHSHAGGSGSGSGSETHRPGPSARPPAEDRPHGGPEEEARPEDNITLFEAFEWYSHSGGEHWRRLQKALPGLKALGVSKIWLPPGCKAGWDQSNGYDVYDLWDIGQFEQKGYLPTKWGRKEDLVHMCRAAAHLEIDLLWDAVLSHKAWADRTECVQVVRVDPEDRNREVEEAKEIEAWLGWDFSGRDGAYSRLKLSAEHFNATDYDQRTQTPGIYRLAHKQWADDVDHEKGNFDFLLMNNYDLSHPNLRNDFVYWAQWLSHELGPALAGFRFDAVKHMSRNFMAFFVHAINTSRPLFFVGEYASDRTESLECYLDDIRHPAFHLFDFALHSRFVGACERTAGCNTPDTPDNFDLAGLLNDTLLARRPRQTVTFVTNHDTQFRGSDAMEGTAFKGIAAWFVPLAYTLILLHRHSLKPCVFFGDLYGVNGPDESPRGPSCRGALPRLMLLRRLYAYGPQHDYFDEPDCVGFTREGHPLRNGGAGLAVLLCTAASLRTKAMYVGRQHRGEVWTGALPWVKPVEIVIGHDGWADFPVLGHSCAVWLSREAEGRRELDGLHFDTHFYCDR